MVERTNQMSIRAQRAAAAQARLILPDEERDFDYEAITEERKEISETLQRNDVIGEMQRNMNRVGDIRAQLDGVRVSQQNRRNEEEAKRELIEELTRP